MSQSAVAFVPPLLCPRKARILVLNVDSPTRATLQNAFVTSLWPNEVELVPESDDPIAQLEQIKLDGCVIGLQPGAGDFFEALRNSSLNQRAVLYAFGNPAEAFWYARYGVNVVIQKPFSRSQALKVLSATRGLLLYDLMRSLKPADVTPDPMQDSGFLAGASPERDRSALRSERYPLLRSPEAQGALAPDLIQPEALPWPEAISPAVEPVLDFPASRPIRDFAFSELQTPTPTSVASAVAVKLAPAPSIPVSRRKNSPPPASFSSNSQFVRTAIIASLLVSVALVGLGARMVRIHRSSPTASPQLTTTTPASTSTLVQPATLDDSSSSPTSTANNESSSPGATANVAAAAPSANESASASQPVQPNKHVSSSVVAEDVVIRRSALRALSAVQQDAPSLSIPAMVAPSLPARQSASLAPTHVASRPAPGEVLLRVAPFYPALAKQAHLEGKVLLEASIANDGSVSKVARLSGSPLLAEAAIAALKSWRYRPAFEDGKPVESITQVSFNFTLNGR